MLFVSIAGELDRYGMVQNLSKVKQVIREITSQLNFCYLNDIWQEFQQTLPTTENIAPNYLAAPHLPLVRVQLFEHPELWAVLSRKRNGSLSYY